MQKRVKFRVKFRVKWDLKFRFWSKKSKFSNFGQKMLIFVVFQKIVLFFYVTWPFLCHVTYLFKSRDLVLKSRDLFISHVILFLPVLVKKFKKFRFWPIFGIFLKKIKILSHVACFCRSRDLFKSRDPFLSHVTLLIKSRDPFI